MSCAFMKDENGNPTAVKIEDTNFVPWFKNNPNFQGDPDRDNYGSNARKGDIFIPDLDFAAELADLGVNVHYTKPQEGHEEDFVEQAYVTIQANFNHNEGEEWKNPNIYHVIDGKPPVKLDVVTVGNIDRMRIKNVHFVANIYHSKKHPGHATLYIRTMYVEQEVDSDPFYNRFHNVEPTDRIPFDE